MAIQDTLKQAVNPFGVPSTPQKPYQVIPIANKNEQRPSETSPKVLGAATGGAGGDTDPATAAFYADRVNRFKSLLGSIPTQRDQGKANIEAGYSKGVSRLNEDQSRNLRDIGIKREETGEDKLKTVRNIDANVSNTADSFQRLLGLGRAGVSAFAREFVPTATARMGSQQRGEAFDTFGRNDRKLDLTEDDSNAQYVRTKQDLDEQKSQRFLDFLGGIDTYEQELRDSASEAAFNQQKALGGGAGEVRAAIAPFAAGSDSVIQRLQQLFSDYRDPTYTVNPISAQIPELEGYTADPMAAKLATANPTTPTQDLPYLPSLRKRFGSLVA